MGVPQVGWMVYFMENPIHEWMMTGGTTYFRKPPYNHQFKFWVYNQLKNWNCSPKSKSGRRWCRICWLNFEHSLSDLCWLHGALIDLTFFVWFVSLIELIRENCCKINQTFCVLGRDSGILYPAWSCYVFVFPRCIYRRGKPVVIE